MATAPHAAPAPGAAAAPAAPAAAAPRTPTTPRARGWRVPEFLANTLAGVYFVAVLILMLAGASIFTQDAIQRFSDWWGPVMSFFTLMQGLAQNWNPRIYPGTVIGRSDKICSSLLMLASVLLVVQHLYFHGFVAPYQWVFVIWLNIFIAGLNDLMYLRQAIKLTQMTP